MQKVPQVSYSNSPLENRCEALMKALAGSFAKFGRKVQVVMGARRIQMPQVSSQLLQFALHILSLSVPAFQGGDGCAVAQIVNPGRTPLLIQHTCA
jgi:hypothetical protein